MKIKNVESIVILSPFHQNIDQPDSREVKQTKRGESRETIDRECHHPEKDFAKNDQPINYVIGCAIGGDPVRISDPEVIEHQGKKNQPKSIED